MSKCQQNSSLKMCVLSALTNNGTFSVRLIAIGRAFHNRGPTTLNERSPKLTSFVRGTANMCCCEERVRPVEHCRFSMSARYSGAVPLMHRKMCRRILNSMRRLIGNQCSCLRVGVMWSRPGVKVIIRAAMFCIIFAGAFSSVRGDVQLEAHFRNPTWT